VTNITGIGSSLVSKIKEILITGKLRKVESLNVIFLPWFLDKRNRAMKK